MEKNIVFDNCVDLKWCVEGFEYSDDEDRMMSMDEIDFDGEYFCEYYKDFDTAIRKYIELKDKGWEVVRISANTTDIRYKSGVSVMFMCGDILVDINLDEINKDMSEAIDKIKKIVNKVGR